MKYYKKETFTSTDCVQPSKCNVRDFIIFFYKTLLNTTTIVEYKCLYMKDYIKKLKICTMKKYFEIVVHKYTKKRSDSPLLQMFIASKILWMFQNRCSCIARHTHTFKALPFRMLMNMF